MLNTINSIKSYNIKSKNNHCLNKNLIKTSGSNQCFSKIPTTTHKAYTNISFKGSPVKTLEETLPEIIKLSKYGKQEAFQRPLNISSNGFITRIKNFYPDLNQSINKLEKGEEINDICNRLSEVYGHHLQKKFPQKMFYTLVDSSKNEYGVTHYYLVGFDKNDKNAEQFKDIISQRLHKMPKKEKEEIFKNAIFIDPSKQTFGKPNSEAFKHYSQDIISSLDNLSDLNKDGLILMENRPIIIGSIKSYLPLENFKKLKYRLGEKTCNEKSQLVLFFDEKVQRFRTIISNPDTKILSKKGKPQKYKKNDIENGKEFIKELSPNSQLLKITSPKFFIDKEGLHKKL